ncbi:MAG TPA: 2-amino-4-hydroxy-6-hydroxymethyldihydropteridine diphosphokinase, partial [Bacilli bacterium]
MNTAFISIGSNIAKEVNIPAVFHRLQRQFTVANISRVYETAPIGPLGQHTFWNAAAEIRTPLSPIELSKKLKEMEADFGRKRDAANKYAPRPLDLDLILFNDLVVANEQIKLPSPQLDKFAFVLMPIAEIAPDYVHPKSGQTLAAMAENFHDETQTWDIIFENKLKGAAETDRMRKKTVLITGGAVRIGREISRFFAEKGYAVAIHYHCSATRAEQLAREIRAHGGAACCLQADLRTIGALEQLVAGVIDRWGYLDTLVNNAAVFYPTPITEMNPEQWDELLAINLRSPHFLIQNAYPHLRRTNGAIVNIADIYAERPLSTHSIYCATKAGLVALTKSLAQELAPQIRVNAVAPG